MNLCYKICVITVYIDTAVLIIPAAPRKTNRLRLVFTACCARDLAILWVSVCILVFTTSSYRWLWKCIYFLVDIFVLLCHYLHNFYNYTQILCVHMNWQFIFVKFWFKELFGGNQALQRYEETVYRVTLFLRRDPFTEVKIRIAVFWVMTQIGKTFQRNILYQSSVYMFAVNYFESLLIIWSVINQKYAIWTSFLRLASNIYWCLHDMPGV